MESEVLQLGAVAVLFLVGIREFFSYLKLKKDSETSGNGGASTTLSKAILGELQTMNSNHLHTIQKCVEDGNRQLIETIHSDNIKMIELLGEIKGILSLRR